MTETRNCLTRSRKSLWIIAALLPAVLGAEASVSSSMAQKAKFERNKPHVNVGTVSPSSATGIDFQNLTIDGQSGLHNQAPVATQQLRTHRIKRRPARRVQRRIIRLRPRTR